MEERKLPSAARRWARSSHEGARTRSAGAEQECLDRKLDAVRSDRTAESPFPSHLLKAVSLPVSPESHSCAAPIKSDIIKSSWILAPTERILQARSQKGMKHLGGVEQFKNFKTVHFFWGN